MMEKKLLHLSNLVLLLLTSTFFIPGKAIAQEERIITGVVAALVKARKSKSITNAM